MDWSGAASAGSSDPELSAYCARRVTNRVAAEHLWLSPMRERLESPSRSTHAHASDASTIRRTRHRRSS